MDNGAILGVIQARMASRRLPGKVIKEINGKPLILYLYERLTFSRLIDKIVIATGADDLNLPIVQVAQENQIEYFAGSEEDLVDRFYQAARKFNGRVIVRVTGDCPLTDPELIDKMIAFYLENPDKYDCVTNILNPTYPDGLDIEVMPFRTIERAWNEVKNPFWREWVFSYIAEHPKDYRLGSVENDRDLSDLRWTVDYKEDFVFVNEIFNRLYHNKKNFSMNDVLKLLDEEPHLVSINRKYTRNIDYERAKKERTR